MIVPTMRSIGTAAALAAIALAAPAPIAAQAPIIVDAAGGPGAQFTQLQPAIDAAGPGAVLLIRAGTYRAFTLAKGLALVGEDGAIVTGPSAVRDVPAGQHVRIRNLFLETLVIERCPGLVAAEILNLTPPSTPFGPSDVTVIDIVDSADVRMRQLGINPGRNSGRDGVRVRNSRFSVDGGAIDGAAGSATGIARTGGVGLRCFAGADVTVAFSRVRGGAGDVGFQGGVALHVGAGARAAVTGSEENELIGAAGSIFGCSQPNAAVHVDAGGSLRLSHRVRVSGGTSLCAPQAPAFTGPGVVSLANPVDLSLVVRGGIVAVGVPSQLLVLGEVGESVAILAGLTPQVLPLPSFRGSPLLLTPVIAAPLGAVQASGDLIVPAGTPGGALGAMVLLQAVSLRAAGTLHLSNSTVLISGA